ncbi:MULTISPECIES: YiiX/YebB-like N1pC/P60 family cysteine hydrolase [unclassified Gilliamella]|uniref:YiiX/YebB-like N1pC/P60 family cysteine hydrolase n=1 Tax=unclassified Gilliamella TaxID=2685620 RepID=UPI00226AF1E3|nr:MULTISPECIES: YiiX/YebB-like N1pC/P60 family cysteine hydrolase [unclassified Gilliamella]MCX8643097.1 hypothetical protein [Gilliamella sp. B3835]MCX8708488.1 hypothetical protein [Gilliamella sp. B3783]MCX8709486.1 hypothetical protein [Gilliamella sp. B3780]MCX8713043.1 hypothetical protein [Gilliamella sp. B3468]MCX8714985.1 hypothetical protein [Gilliamella sp. B3781]
MAPPRTQITMQIGDIIFQAQNEESEFNTAITHSGAQISADDIINQISHVGLYIGDNIVIEATQKHGVIYTPLNDFLAVAKYNLVATIYDESVIKNALTRVQTCLGLPYNHSFRADDKGFYCSELITFAFKYPSGKDYFQLYPMNFKDSVTNQIIPYWIDYYRALNQTIPQGALGSHPQQLMRQTHLFKTIRTY